MQIPQREPYNRVVFLLFTEGGEYLGGGTPVLLFHGCPGFGQFVGLRAIEQPAPGAGESLDLSLFADKGQDAGHGNGEVEVLAVRKVGRCHADDFTAGVEQRAAAGTGAYRGGYLYGRGAILAYPMAAYYAAAERVFQPLRVADGVDGGAHPGQGTFGPLEAGEPAA